MTVEGQRLFADCWLSSVKMLQQCAVVALPMFSSVDAEQNTANVQCLAVQV